MPFIKHHKEPDKRLRTKPKRKKLDGRMYWFTKARIFKASGCRSQ